MARKSTAALAAVQLSHTRMEPPMQLTGRQCDLWREITGSLPADFFRPGDVPLLVAYCKAYDFYLLAAAELEANGVTIETEGGRRQANPAANVMVTQASALAQLSVKLRLSPSSRVSEKKAGRQANETSQAIKPWATG